MLHVISTVLKFVHGDPPVVSTPLSMFEATVASISFFVPVPTTVVCFGPVVEGFICSVVCSSVCFAVPQPANKLFRVGSRARSLSVVARV